MFVLLPVVVDDDVVGRLDFAAGGIGAIFEKIIIIIIKGFLIGVP